MQGDSLHWVSSEGQKRLATENLVPGNQVYKERLVLKKGTEYRVWDPFRSKLAAAVFCGLETFPFCDSSKVLYLGASSGTTVSHISDIVGPKGRVFAVEHSSRVARDFLDRVAAYRPNIVPIMQDARRPNEYFGFYGKVDIVYSDIAQPDQTDIAIENCKTYLEDGGYLFLVIKTRSIDAVVAPSKIIELEIKKLDADFDLLQRINLLPYDIDHVMIVARYTGC